MFAFVEIPINCYGLVEEIWIGLHDTMSPKDLDEYNWDIWPIVVDIISIDSFDWESDCKDIDEHQTDWDTWEKYWDYKKIDIVPKTYLCQTK